MKLKGILNYLMAFTVFSGGFVIYFTMFEFYYFYAVFFIVILSFIVLLNPISINKAFVLFFLLILFISFVNSIINNIPIYYFLKQAIGIFFSALASYLIIKINNYNSGKLFCIYLDIAWIICLIGLFQEASYLINFHYGYNYSYFIPKWGSVRSFVEIFMPINSIMTEPSALAVVLTPAMYASMNNILTSSPGLLSRTRSLIILTAYILTFSAVGFLGIMGAIIFIFYNKNFSFIKTRQIWFNSTIFIIAIISIIFITFAYAPGIKTRIYDGMSIMSLSPGKKDLTQIYGYNTSVIALFTNLLVALDSFQKNPLFGSSLGAHEFNYYRYYETSLPLIILNTADANSLLLRLLSETGIFGTMIVLFFLFKYYVNEKNSYLVQDRALFDKLSILNNGILLMFFLRLLRAGHYFIEGVFFFAFLYYFSGKKCKTMIQDNGTS